MRSDTLIDHSLVVLFVASSLLNNCILCFLLQKVKKFSLAEQSKGESTSTTKGPWSSFSFWLVTSVLNSDVTFCSLFSSNDLVLLRNCWRQFKNCESYKFNVKLTIVILMWVSSRTKPIQWHIIIYLWHNV